MLRPALFLTACLVALPVHAEPLAELPEELHPFEESPRDLHWGRMFLEAGLLFGGLEIPYWMNKEANSFDFEYVAGWRWFKERFITLRAWSLDDNYFNTNGWRHSAQGGLNYLFARSNGFSSTQSYVVSLALSAAWEFFGEYREEVSINDLVMTPRSGAVLGESFWQLGVFLLRGDDNWFNQIVGNSLTGGRGLLDRLDGKTAYHARRRSTLGFDASLPHRFELSFTGGTQKEGETYRDVFRIGLETEIISIPGFDRPGSVKQLRTAPSFTQLHVEATRDDETWVDFRALARAAVTVWHRKDIADNGDGWNLVYGFSSAYEYGFHESLERDTPITRDRVALAHLLGPTFDLTMRRGRLKARAVFDIYADWGLLRNYAMDAHRAAYPDEEVRSTIVRDNYYHAIGLTGIARLQLDYRTFAGGLAYQIDEMKSVQGIDRHQADLVEDYSLFDQREEGRIWLRSGYDLTRDLALELELAVEMRDRSGRVRETERAEHERRYVGAMNFVF